jgi:hypothetical protein
LVAVARGSGVTGLCTVESVARRAVGGAPGTGRGGRRRNGPLDGVGGSGADGVGGAEPTGSVGAEPTGSAGARPGSARSPGAGRSASTAAPLRCFATGALLG